MNTQPNMTDQEATLRMALSLVADKFGKAEAIRIFEEWCRTKLEPAR